MAHFDTIRILFFLTNFIVVSGDPSCVTDSDCEVNHGKCVSASNGGNICVCEKWYYGNGDVCHESYLKAPIYGTYMGCYEVDKSARVFVQSAGDYDSTSFNTFSCTEACSNQDYKYAATQECRACFCGGGSSLPSVSMKADDSKCDCPCSLEDPFGYGCGGCHDLFDGVVIESYSSVFATQVGVSNFSIDLSSVTQNPYTEEEFQIAITIVPPEGFPVEWLEYKYDFGDTFGFSEPVPETTQTFKFARPGNKIVSAGVDQREPLLDATRVYVREKLLQDCIETRCEQFYRHGYTSNCSVSVTCGTSCKVDIDWSKDEKVYGFVGMEDPYFLTVGEKNLVQINPSSYRLDDDYKFPSTGMVLVVNAYTGEFQHECILSGFEYCAMGSGNLRFALFAPDCAANEIWCHQEQQCISKDATCSSPFSYDCTEYFCQLKGGCSENTCYQNNRNTTFGGNRYKRIDDSQLEVTLEASCATEGCCKYAKFPLADRLIVYPGTVIGVYIPSSAKIIFSKRTDDYFGQFFEFAYSKMEFDGSSGTQLPDNVALHFQAYCVQPSTINLTNYLEGPSLDPNIEVKIYVTGDGLQESDPGVIRHPTTNQLCFFYHITGISLIEGFDNVSITHFYRTQPYAMVGREYPLQVDVVNNLYGITEKNVWDFNIQFEVDWGDSDPIETITGMLEPFVLTHIYASEGAFNMCIKATNDVSHDIDCVMVYGQYPLLPEHFEISQSPDYVDIASGELTASFKKLNPGSSYFSSTFPTNASIIIDFRDPSTFLEEDIVPNKHVYELSYTYLRPGLYEAAVVALNKVSRVQKTLKIGVYEPVEGLVVLTDGYMLDIDYKTDKSNMSKIKPLIVEPYSGGNRYLHNILLYFVLIYNQSSANVNQTTVYEWNDQSVESTHSVYLSNVGYHKFSFDGDVAANLKLDGYVDLDFTLTVSNPLFSASMTTGTYRIVVPPNEIGFTANGQMWGINKTVEVSVDIQGSLPYKACMLIACVSCQEPFAAMLTHFDHDKPSADANLIDNAAKLKGFQRCKDNLEDYQPAFVKNKLTEHNVINEAFDDSLVFGEGGAFPAARSSRILPENKLYLFKHHAQTQGSYAIYILCWNPAGIVETEWPFSKVEPMVCNYPLISIENTGPAYFLPTIYYKSQKSIINALVNLDCTPMSNTKTWRCLEFDTEIGEEIPNSEVDTSLLKGTSINDLTIPPLALDYGTYKCYFKVYMHASVPEEDLIYQSETFTYIKIDPYPLLGSMFRASSSKTMCKKQKILLNPAEYSLDLDKPDSKFIEWYWYCRVLSFDELYPYKDGELDNEYPPTNILRESGCFGKGPGRIEVSSGRYSLDLSIPTFHVEEIYEFMATFRAEGDQFDRLGTATIQINITADCSPDMQIQSGTGTVAEPRVTPDLRSVQTINPIGVFRIISECMAESEEECENIVYDWVVERAIDLEADMRADSNYEKIEFPAHIATDDENLALNASMLQPFTKYEYRVTLFTNFFGKISTGKTFMFLRVNRPPENCNCTAYHKPLEKYGNPYLNYLYWRYECNSCIDPDEDEIKFYHVAVVKNYIECPINLTHVFVEFPDCSEVCELSSSPETFGNFRAPPGHEEYDYKIQLCYQIEDKKGAWNWLCKEPVEFKVPNLTIIYQMAGKELTTVIPEEIDFDTPHAKNLRNNYLLIREIQAQNENLTKFQEEGSAKNICQTIQSQSETMQTIKNDLLSIQAKLNALNESGEFELMVEEEQELYNATLKAVNLLIALANSFMTTIRQTQGNALNSISKDALNSKESLNIIAAAASEIANDEKQLTPQTRMSLLGKMQDSIDSLNDMLGATDQVSVNNVLTNALSALGGVIVSERDSTATSNEEVTTTTAATTTPSRSVSNPSSSSHESNGIQAVDQTNSFISAGLSNCVTSEEVAIVKKSVCAKAKKVVDAKRSSAGTLDVSTQGEPNSVTAKLPDLRYLASFDRKKPVSMSSFAYLAPPVLGFPNEDLVGKKSAFLTITLSNSTSNSRIPAKKARKSLDLHIKNDAIDSIISATRDIKGHITPGRDHQFIILNMTMNGDQALRICVEPKIRILDEFTCVYVRYGEEPTYDYLTGEFTADFRKCLPRNLTKSEKKRHESEYYPNQWCFIIENHKLKNSGTYFIGIRPCRINKLLDYYQGYMLCSNKVFKSDFVYTANTLMCLFRNDEDTASNGGMYRTANCVVGTNSDADTTECLCNHMTSFVGSLLPPPPALDFSKMEFDWSAMYPVYSVLIALWIIFFVLLFWARRADKLDIEKLGFTPLPDNDPNDYYIYEMAVQTNMIKGAGTRSNVYFYIVGEHGKTRVRQLRDPYRKILRRDSKDLFILTVPNSLGPLRSVRIWHDNTGIGSDQSWFLDYIAFRDVQTGEKSFFMNYRWLSLVHDDGSIDRTIEKTEPGELKRFRYLFASKTREKFNDGHLYYSIFARPPESNFTRTQRCASAMCVILLEFCVSAVYYQTKQNIDDSSAVWVGPIKFNINELGVSVVSTLFVLPLSLVIVQLFRKTKPFSSDDDDSNELDADEEMRQQRENKRLKRKLLRRSPSSASISSIKTIEISTRPTTSKSVVPSISFTVDNPDGRTTVLESDLDGIGYDSEFSDYSSTDFSELSSDEDLDRWERMRRSRLFCCIAFCMGWGDRQKRRNGPFMLPPTFIYIAWLLVFFTMIGCSVIITLYAAMIAFKGGASLVGKWVISMIGSLVTSICLIQPFKILLVATFLTIICGRGVRKNKNTLNEEEEVEEEVDDFFSNLDKDRHLTTGKEIGDIIVGVSLDEDYAHQGDHFVRKKLLPGELTREQKIKLKIERQKEIQMVLIFREIAVYLLFTWLLFSCCYLERDPTSYMVYEQVKGILVDGKFDSVTDIDSYWDYLLDHFIPNMFSTEWYNGQRPFGLFGYFGDKINFVIGYSIIRQIRIQPALCDPYEVRGKPIARECNEPFDISKEQKRRFGPKWGKFDANNPYHQMREEYRYVSQEDIDGYGFWGQSAYFSGGGYLIRLDGQLNDTLDKIRVLKDELWIDHYTRAIFHEFSVYNPAVNLFGVVTMILEIRPSSGAFPYYYCDPVKLIMYHGDSAAYQVLVQIGCGIFLVVFVFRDVMKIYKMRKKFFMSTWCVLDLIIDGLAIAAIIAFMIRYVLTENALAQVSLLGGRQFVNLQYLVYMSQVYLYTLAFICFLCNIRFLRILNFNKKISMFRDVLVSCKNDLISYAVMFFVLEAGFVTMAFLFFGRYLVRYRTPFQVLQSLFNMLLGKFSFEELIEIDYLLGSIFFMSYSNTMMLISLNIFVAILNESVADVNEGLVEKSNEYEIVNFFLKRAEFFIKDTFQGAKTTVHELKHHKAIEQRKQLESSISELPDKLDHLLEIINERYFEGKEEFELKVNKYADVRRKERRILKSAGTFNKIEESSEEDEYYEKLEEKYRKPKHVYIK